MLFSYCLLSYYLDIWTATISVIEEDWGHKSIGHEALRIYTHKPNSKSLQKIIF